MKLEQWKVLISSLWDDGCEGSQFLQGQEVEEWLYLSLDDYNEVDQFLIDQETKGG